MRRVVFLLDEHIPTYVGDALVALEPAIEVVQVGVDPAAPPKGTLDPEVLSYAEANEFAVVTFDKETMRDEAYQHVANGGHTWGVFLFADGNNLSAGRMATELLMIWAASEAEEWIDKVEFLPY